MPRKKKDDLTPTYPADLARGIRNQDMFFDWINGMSYRAIGEKYGLNKNTVCDIAQKGKWQIARKDLAQRKFSTMLRQLDSVVFKSVNMIDRDLERLMKKFDDGTEPLTSEERNHVRALLDRILKEKRLEEGKPTDIQTGPVVVELKLPPGVKDFGVIPTTGRTINVIEGDEDEVAETVDLEAIEDAMENDDDDV